MIKINHARIKAGETKQYWLSIKTDENDRKKVIASLKKIGLNFNDRYIVCTSEDLNQLKTVAREFSETMKKSKYPGMKEDPSICIELVSQPQCLQCGFLGKFSDKYCSECGSDLLEKEYIEWGVK